MPKYAELLTDLDVAALKAMHPRQGKELLAKTLTAMFHGQEAAQKAADEFARVFSKKEMPEEISEFKMSKPATLISELIVEAGLAPSKNEARRLLDQGAVKVGQEKANATQIIATMHLPVVIQVGKRRFVRVVAAS